MCTIRYALCAMGIYQFKVPFEMEKNRKNNSQTCCSRFEGIFMKRKMLKLQFLHWKIDYEIIYESEIVFEFSKYDKKTNFALFFMMRISYNLFFFCNLVLFNLSVALSSSSSSSRPVSGRVTIRWLEEKKQYSRTKSCQRAFFYFMLIVNYTLLHGHIMEHETRWIPIGGVKMPFFFSVSAFRI